MQIIMAGDFYVNKNLGWDDPVDKNIIDVFDQADYRIINIESPISVLSDGNKIQKTGPHLCMLPSDTIPILKLLKINIAVLANNHIMDYGEGALRSTFKILKSNNIDFTGAGINITEAKKPITLEKNGLKVGVLNFTENEWSTADYNMAGANPVDLINIVTCIKKLKLSHDKVIVVIHGGHEYYEYPSPRMVKEYRFYVDNGADVIVGHHPHCINGYEIYNGCPIFYSLGNFMFTINSKNESWYTGLVLKLNYEQDNKLTFELIPIKQDEFTFRVEKIQGKEFKDISNKLIVLSEAIKNNRMLRDKWNSFILSKKESYINSLSVLSPLSSKYFKLLVRISRINKIFVNKNHQKLLLNLIKCESHRDALICSIKEKLR